MPSGRSTSGLRELNGSGCCEGRCPSVSGIASPGTETTVQKSKRFFVINLIIAAALLALFGLLATPVHGDTKEPDRSECGSMFTVLREGADAGGEPRIDQAAFNTSCVHSAKQRRNWVGGLAALAVSLGAFEVLFRRMEDGRRVPRADVVQPFRD